MRRSLHFVVAALLNGAGAVHGSTFQKLLFHPGQDAIIGSHHLRLEGPDNQSSPTLWEGPLRITTESQTCNARVSLVTSVWAAPQAQFVVVVTDSGSSTFVNFIDTSSCAAKWPRIKAFTEEVKILPERIQIMPGCTCDKSYVPCSCSAAEVYRLTDFDAPVLLEGESRALTKQTLGVEFSGIRKVLHPRTPEAR